MAAVKDLTGMRFERLAVLSLAEAGQRKPRDTGRAYVVRCDCGAEFTTRGKSLLSGNTKSCGCLRIANRFKTHGQTKSTEYRIWSGLVTRCCNPNHHSYDNYGGRGIFLAPEWRENFSAFYEHIGSRPSPAYSVDRIDNDKGYQPGNVRWATRTEQGNNRRNNVIVEYRGERMTVAQAARSAGVISCDVAHARIFRYGWSVEKAVESPPKFKRKPKRAA